MSDLDDLTAFLLVRIAEDKGTAEDALTRSSYGQADTAFHEAVELAEGEGARGPAIEHITRWDPARVAVECESKSWFVGFFDSMARTEPEGLVTVGNKALRLLALAYADHPDYQQKWKP